MNDVNVPPGEHVGWMSMCNPVGAPVASVAQQFDLALTARVDRRSQCGTLGLIGASVAQYVRQLAADNPIGRVSGEAHEPLIDPLDAALGIGNDDGVFCSLDDRDEASMPFCGPIDIGALALQSPDNRFEDKYDEQRHGEHLSDGPREQLALLRFGLRRKVHQFLGSDAVHGEMVSTAGCLGGQSEISAVCAAT